MTTQPVSGELLPATPEQPIDSAVMPLVDHLAELRGRIIWSLVAIGLGSVVGFLLSFPTPVLVSMLTAREYFDFVSTLFLVFGIVMEFPVLLVGLSRVGIVTSERLRRSRRFVLLGITVFSAVVTPGTDLVSPIVLGTAMYVLFELTIIIIRRGGR